MGLRDSAPGIGDIVLFCIDEDFQCWRPLLVVGLEGDRISGELFLDWEKDRRLQWPIKLFYLLDANSRTQWVKNAPRGETLGSWRSAEEKVEKFLKDAPPAIAQKQDLTPRLAPKSPQSRILPLSRVERGGKN